MWVSMAHPQVADPGLIRRGDAVQAHETRRRNAAAAALTEAPVGMPAPTPIMPPVVCWPVVWNPVVCPP
jgi:hypothetical protein